MSESDPNALAELRAVSKHLGEGETRVDALTNISASVFAREVAGLIGPSGSGKATLLNVIGCVTEPSSGWMPLNGEIVCDERWLRRDLRRLRLEKIGFIFQTHNLLPFLDATENVMEVIELAGLRPAAARARAVELLDYLQVGSRRHAIPAELSGGEAQLVAIARALANRPKIILANEPTAPLDSEQAGIVMDLLRRIALDQEAAILVVTHGRLVSIETLAEASADKRAETISAG